MPLFALPHYDWDMSFSETIFLFVLALIVFGPKKLPEIARQAGKLLAELRRASNEFRSQIDAEIAHLDVQKEVQKEVQKQAQKSQAILPPTEAPPGAVASVGQSAAQPVTHQLEAPATLATSAVDSASPPVDEAAAGEPASATELATTPEKDLTPAPASQDSHV